MSEQVNIKKLWVNILEDIYDEDYLLAKCKNKEVANRITACVNAMYGIEKPGYHIKHLERERHLEMHLKQIALSDLIALMNICKTLIQEQGLVGSASASFAPLREFLARRNK
jgi:hypothetical protein